MGLIAATPLLGLRSPTRSLQIYAGLLLILVAVHFIVTTHPHVVADASQTVAFSWPVIGIGGALGALGIVCVHHTRLPGLRDRNVSVELKLLWPLVAGLLFGALAVPVELLTHIAHNFARSAGATNTNIPFPYSVPLYVGGAIITTTLYYLIIIPPAVHLFSARLLQGRYQERVYWVVGMLLACVEPITNAGHALTSVGSIGLVLVAESFAFNLMEVWFFRRGGFIATIVYRLGYYAVFRVIYGDFFWQ